MLSHNLRPVRCAGWGAGKAVFAEVFGFLKNADFHKAFYSFIACIWVTAKGFANFGIAGHVVIHGVVGVDEDGYAELVGGQGCACRFFGVGHGWFTVFIHCFSQSPNTHAMAL